jgi:protein-L-isoaspartate(D-aspartate) O-methyltransferase
MDTNQARFNMINQQLRPAGVLSADVLDMLGKVQREKFVPDACRHLAFAEISIPLGHGAQMFPPELEALALQALAVQANETVLEIGTGSGYMAALLAQRARHVHTYEIEPSLAAGARAALDHAGIRNVQVMTGDGLAARAPQAPFDVIMVSGAVTAVPKMLLDQLKPGGRLFAVTGTRPAMHATLIERVGDDFHPKALFETDVPYLQGAAPAAQFSF